MADQQQESSSRSGGPPDIGRLGILLDRLLGKSRDRVGLLEGFLRETVALMNAAGAAYWVRGADGPAGECVLFSRQLDQAGIGPDRLRDLADQAIRDSVLVHRRLGQTPFIAVLAPLPRDRGCLCVILFIDEDSLAPFLVTLQLLALLLDQGLLSLATDPSDAASSVSGAVLALFARSVEIAGGSERLVHFNQGLKQLCRADLAVLARAGENGRPRLLAVSDVAEPSAETPLSRALENSIREVAARNHVLAWPGPEPLPDTVRPSPVLAEIGRRAGMARVLALPLSREGSPDFVLILSWRREGDPVPVPEMAGQVRAGIGAMAACLGRARRMPVQRYVRRRLPAILAGKTPRQQALALALLILCLGLLVPLPRRVSGPATVRPETVRFVVSRYPGILEKALVRPGDRVESGQLLALLDRREIEIELAAARAEEARARKMRDQAMALGDTAAAQLADLDRRRFSQKISLLEDQLDHLRITSPIGGVVLSGDLERTEGSPVNRGQTLFEIAPLTRVVIEVAIPENDIGLVRAKAPVRVRFPGLSGWALEKPFDRIRPRVVLVGGQPVFLGILTTVNEGERLRPGMGGDATIPAGIRPLAWILLRRPWYTLLGLLDRIR